MSVSPNILVNESDTSFSVYSIHVCTFSDIEVDALFLILQLHLFTAIYFSTLIETASCTLPMLRF